MGSRQTKVWEGKWVKDRPRCGGRKMGKGQTKVWGKENG